MLHSYLEVAEGLLEDETVHRTTRPQEERNEEEEAFLLSLSWEAVVHPSEEVVARVEDVRSLAVVVHNFQAHQEEAVPKEHRCE